MPICAELLVRADGAQGSTSAYGASRKAPPSRNPSRLLTLLDSGKRSTKGQTNTSPRPAGASCTRHFQLIWRIPCKVGGFWKYPSESCWNPKSLRGVSFWYNFFERIPARGRVADPREMRLAARGSCSLAPKEGLL